MNQSDIPIPFPGSNLDYRSENGRLTNLARDLVRMLKQNETTEPLVIVNLCDGIGVLSNRLSYYLPEAKIHSVDLGNYVKESKAENEYTETVQYHWGEDLVQFLEHSEDSSFDMVTLVRAHFIFMPPSLSSPDYVSGRARAERNTEDLLRLLPQKVKPGGLVFISSAHLNRRLIEGLKEVGFRTEDPDEFLWKFK